MTLQPWQLEYVHAMFNHYMKDAECEQLALEIDFDSKRARIFRKGFEAGVSVMLEWLENNGREFLPKKGDKQ